MTIDEAIKVLQLMTKKRNVSSLEKCIDALRLGTEALKRVKWNRKNYAVYRTSLLPGETKD